MSTMNISLTADVARFVERELERGRFASVNDLVGESLRLLEIELTSEEEKVEALPTGTSMPSLPTRWRSSARGNCSARPI